MGRGEIAGLSFDFSNETEFEDIIVKKQILKEYFVYDAKKTLNIFRKYNRYADVLLIEKNYRYWSIGEVEISKHSFKNHVFPQLIEIYSLMEKNIELIRKNYMNIEGLEKTKQIQDLIMYNKPFLNLIIDKLPNNYNNILPLLKSFCNVNFVQRLRDTDENYMYLTDNEFTKSISESFSYSYVNEVVLIIDNPNLLQLNKLVEEFLIYKEEKIYIKKRFEKIKGTDRLFWIMEKQIPNGKYKLVKENKILKLHR